MIDQKRLDELNEGACLLPNPGKDLPSCHEYSVRICDCERHELIKLARLGLIARDYDNVIRADMLNCDCKVCIKDLEVLDSLLEALTKG